MITVTFNKQAPGQPKDYTCKMERKILHLLSYNSVHWLLLNYTPLERRAQLIKMLTHISLSLLGKTIFRFPRITGYLWINILPMMYISLNQPLIS